MTNIPTRVGDRYLCFEVLKPVRGWSGAYGQVWRGQVWRCVECGFRIEGHDHRETARLAEHHEHGHAPCAYCGKPLLKRKDGTPRQHAANLCPGKGEDYRIEREFVRHINEREYA